MDNNRRVYIILLWNEITKEIDFQQISLEVAFIKSASAQQLSRICIREQDYRTFLEGVLQSWDGKQNLTVTTSEHKIIMLVDDLVASDAPSELDCQAAVDAVQRIVTPLPAMPPRAAAWV